ncbi:hypothetical protein QBC46DRAFT_391318 [Diplogelasinospora grovesii]|uniref:Apple domain-containing protein n=1 Tax=Diplogelasinospora grovesii TaxID=303347 RepID=A0AAN6N564_9PEZI|nr:hypothetical protein QBC46DRAFT_391318 [Diplogelasinospora grovesii]
MDHRHEPALQQSGQGINGGSGSYYPSGGVGTVPEKPQPNQYQYQDHQYQNQQQDPHYISQYPPGAHSHNASAQPTTLGMKRSVFLGILAVSTILLACIIGLGAGLGVSQRNLHQAQTDLMKAQADASAAATTVFTTASPTTTSSSASATATASEIECPASNNTFYISSNSGKKFERFCGLDYSGNGQAVDIGNVKTDSMDACIDACAAKSNCTGCGWGVISGDTGNQHSCWMKSNLTKSHNATADWGFAVLLSS